MYAFLFTDIESSTRLWEEFPEQMASALERHDTILRRSITEAGGKVIKTTGDGAIGVFDSTSDALTAAFDAQRALQTEAWGATPLRVRAGIHSGEAVTRGDDYFGPVMNRTARIMAAGHGGQVLLSSIAVESIRELPDRATVRDLGPHRLKDLTLPEHLFQLVHPDLLSEFPTLRTLDVRPNNLPIQATELIGRTQELATMRTLFDSPGTKLLTIAGPGGAGKTRLGLQLAAELTESFTDGVFFVDLSTETDTESVFEAIVRVLALPVSGSGDARNVLSLRLRDRELLLVLDNFEQVIDAGGPLSELLAKVPKLKIIVTSRETLQVRVERVYPVPPLVLPDPYAPPHVIAKAEAVQLFADRAVAANPHFSVTAENAQTIAEICLRLDGLPLAIELAAARLTVFTPFDLLARLKDRLDVLGAGGRDLPARQRTLWGAIAWSYELLTDEERKLFELLSVFSTTHLPPIEAVAQDVLSTPSAIDNLSSLVAKSLVYRDDTDRSSTFSMLQVIKEYASERLSESSDTAHIAAEAHARYFAEFVHRQAEPMRSEDREAGLRQLVMEIGNVRTAWRYWVAQNDYQRLLEMIDPLWTLLDTNGWYHDAIDLVRDLLDVLDLTDPSPECQAEELTLRTTLARALMAVHGYNLEVEQAFRRALELATEVGDEDVKIPVLRALASYYLQTGDAEKSLAIGEELLKTGLEQNNEGIEIEGHSVIGNALLYVNVDESLAHLSQVIDRYDPGKHRTVRYRLGPDIGVVARISTGMMLWETGRLDSAVKSAESALQLAKEIDHPYSLAWALYHAGFLALNGGRFTDCLAIARRLTEISAEQGYVLWQTLATVLEGASRTALGNHEEGITLTEKGIDLYKGLAPPPIFWPLVLTLRANVYAMARNLKRAIELINEAAAIWEAGGATPPGGVAAEGGSRSACSWRR